MGSNTLSNLPCLLVVVQGENLSGSYGGIRVLGLSLVDELSDSVFSFGGAVVIEPHGGVTLEFEGSLADKS